MGIEFGFTDGIRGTDGMGEETGGIRGAFETGGINGGVGTGGINGGFEAGGIKGVINGGVEDFKGSEATPL